MPSPFRPSAPRGKMRLDLLVVERGLAESREKAQALILAARILVNGAPAPKAGMAVDVTSEITLAGPPMRYVSRGGLKLEAALEAFGVNPAGVTALDIGASTGGFTDCLLQHGAARVVAVDVGRAQLHERLRADPRVELHERINARALPTDFLPVPAGLIVIDVSFISLEKILPALRPLLEPREGRLIALIKPQFEAGRREVPRGGVIRDPAVHERVLEKVRGDFSRCGFELLRVIACPITGADGNQEFLGLARLGAETASEGSARPPSCS